MAPATFTGRPGDVVEERAPFRCINGAMHRRLATALGAALLAIAPGCGSCGKPSSGASVEASVATPPPVPAPAGMLAQAWVRGADALWARLQNGVSGAAGLLPAEVGSLLCAATGLDAAVGPLVDGKAVAFVVVADEPGGAGDGPGWAAAVPLKDGGRVASLLLPADAGAGLYTARDEQGMRVLTRTGHPLVVPAALAQGWLVLARTDADLARLGPYAWRTMPTLAAPAGAASIEVALAHEALASRAGAAWDQARDWLSARDREERERHAGRAPDFGDPQAILDAADVVVKRRVALLSGASRVTLELEAGDDDVRVDAHVSPAADAGASGLGMAPGDARPLGDAPGDALLAVLVRDRAAARADDARELEVTLARALGSRAQGEDNRAVAAAIDAWAASRGDWLTASLGVGAAPRRDAAQSRRRGGGARPSRPDSSSRVVRPSRVRCTRPSTWAPPRSPRPTSRVCPEPRSRASAEGRSWAWRGGFGASSSWPWPASARTSVSRRRRRRGDSATIRAWSGLSRGSEPTRAWSCWPSRCAWTPRAPLPTPRGCPPWWRGAFATAPRGCGSTSATSCCASSCACGAGSERVSSAADRMTCP